ncbi:unnamed protein product [Lathyrus oleraceus]
MDKLKSLKVVMRSWNKEIFGKIDSQIDSQKEEVNKVGSLVDLSTLSAEEIDSRYIVVSSMLSLLRIKCSQLFQKSRSKWLKEGDTNSSYFHSSIKSRSLRNTILELKFGEDWIEGVSEIRQEVVNHFTRIFKEPNFERHRPDGIVFYSLSVEDILCLLAPFSF